MNAKQVLPCGQLLRACVGNNALCALQTKLSDVLTVPWECRLQCARVPLTVWLSDHIKARQTYFRNSQTVVFRVHTRDCSRLRWARNVSGWTRKLLRRNGLGSVTACGGAVGSVEEMNPCRFYTKRVVYATIACLRRQKKRGVREVGGSQEKRFRKRYRYQ